jgi:hypothetical protein
MIGSLEMIDILGMISALGTEGMERIDDLHGLPVHNT